MSPRHFWILLLFVLVTGAMAQVLECDSSVDVEENDPNHYQLRKMPAGSERCEGVYFQDVAAYASVVSFVTFKEEVTFTDEGYAEILTLRWIEPPVQVLGDAAITDVRIKAVSQVYQFYYKMDTQDLLGQTVFSWPTDRLRVLNLGTKDIGVRVQGETPIGSVLLPLQLSSGTTDTTESDSSYEVAIVIPAEVTKLTYTVFDTKDGYANAELFSGDAGLYTSNPGGRPIPFVLDMEGQNPGIYALEISGRTTRDREPVRLMPTLFYHAGG